MSSVPRSPSWRWGASCSASSRGGHTAGGSSIRVRRSATGRGRGSCRRYPCSSRSPSSPSSGSSSGARYRERTGKSTLLALRLFSISSFRNGNIAAAVVSLGEFGIILALPLWLQFVLGFEAVQTGLLLLALAGGSFLASGVAGAASGKIAPVWVVRVGLIAEIVGVAGVGFVIGPDASWGPLIPFLFVYGLGVGLATAQLTGVVLAEVPVADSGAASGTQSTSRQIGAALGVAVLGTVLFTSTAGILASSLDERGVPAAQRDQIVSAVVDSAGAAISGLEANAATADAAEDAKAAFSEGTRYAAWTAAGFLALGLLATVSLGSATVRARPEEAEV